LATSAKPLEGKRVVVTRAPEQAGALARELEALGAQVVFLPAIQFADPLDFAALDGAIETLEKFDWLIFTSQNAVRFFARRAAALGKNVSAAAAGPAGRTRIAVIGQATARAARSAGFAIDYAATRSTGNDLASELSEAVRSRRVLVPASDRAGEELPGVLARAGAEVVRVVAYRTVAAPAADSALETLRRGEVDVVSFASPSAFIALAGQLGREALARLVLAAIGPTTARAIRAAGLPVAIEARKSNSAGLAEAIADYFSASAAPSRFAGSTDAQGAEKP